MSKPDEFFQNKLEWNKESLNIDASELVYKKNFWVCSKCGEESPVEKVEGKLKFIPPESCPAEGCESRIFSLRAE